MQPRHRVDNERTMVDVLLGELLALVVISLAVAVGDIVLRWRLKQRSGFRASSGHNRP